MAIRYTKDTLPRPFSFHVPMDKPDFDWTVASHVIGHYVPGCSYTVRVGDRYNDLAEKVCLWLDNDMIAPGRLDGGGTVGGG